MDDETRVKMKLSKTDAPKLTKRNKEIRSRNPLTKMYNDTNLLPFCRDQFYYIPRTRRRLVPSDVLCSNNFEMNIYQQERQGIDSTCIADF